MNRYDARRYLDEHGLTCEQAEKLLLEASPIGQSKVNKHLPRSMAIKILLAAIKAIMEKRYSHKDNFYNHLITDDLIALNVIRECL